MRDQIKKVINDLIKCKISKSKAIDKISQLWGEQFIESKPKPLNEIPKDQ